MTDFRQNFLAESIDNLTDLQKRMAEGFDENLRREAFRIIHTVKGGAQTFNLQDAAKIAHELENLLSNNTAFHNKNLLAEGIEVLANSLRQGETVASADFVEKLQNSFQTAAKSDILLTKIPPEVFKKFSEQEQNAAIKAIRDGKNIYCAEIGFEAADFAARYRDLRKVLGEKTEIIASLPTEKFKSEGKFGFRIFLASHETIENLQKSVKDFDVEISSHACMDHESRDLYVMLSQIAAHAESIAVKARKTINISILSNDVALSAARTKAFFDILLHLVRNAVDHAVERRGTIEIRFFDEPEGLHLSVADDGKGINLEKIRAHAIEKNLISVDDFLDEQQTIQLIFASEFSTAERVSETSGRGVGLDAVKAAVEKMNGKITVRNRKTNGAIFEIFVPRD